MINILKGRSCLSFKLNLSFNFVSPLFFYKSAVDRVTSKIKTSQFSVKACAIFFFIIKCVYWPKISFRYLTTFRVWSRYERIFLSFICFKFNVNKLFQLNESCLVLTCLEDIKGMQNSNVVKKIWHIFYNNHSYT